MIKMGRDNAGVGYAQTRAHNCQTKKDRGLNGRTTNYFILTDPHGTPLQLIK